MRWIKNICYDIKKNPVLMLMILPVILYVIIFSYLPMSGLVLAFKQFDYSLGIFGSPWCGFSNFKFFFISGQAAKVIRNTVLYNVAFIIVNNVVEITVAIFISEIGGKLFKKLTQGAMFLPTFISWVVVSAFVYNIFSYDFGAFNNLRESMGMQPVDIYSQNTLWIFMIIFLNSWKHVGYGSVVYLAAIMSIDAEIYESATLDGAGELQKIWYVTLPNLKPTVIILVIMGIGNIFRGDFDLFYQMVGTNSLLFNTTDVIDTFVFRSLLFSQEYGMSAAVGLFQSVLCFIFLTATNLIIRKIDPDNSLY